MKHMLSGMVFSGLCTLLFLFGCSKRTVPDFVRAQVTIRFPTDGELEVGTKVITDREKVKRLASFFPRMGEGRSSSRGAGWEPDGTIEFFSSDGESVTVMFDSHFEFWSESTPGHGDWPLSREFRPYFVKLMKD